MSNSYGDPTTAKPAIDTRLTWLMVAAAFLASFFLIRHFQAQGKAVAAGAADYSWKVADLDGKISTLSQYKGKAIFLNVWATWCGPCRQEMPSIARLAANPRLKNVAFLCVSQDDGIQEVRDYLNRTGKQPMTMLHARSPAPKPFQTDGIPATFLIAPDGRIARSEIGSMDWDDPEIVDFLAGLAKE